MDNNLKQLSDISNRWLVANESLNSVEEEMSEPFAKLMSDAKSLDDFRDILDILPKRCKVARRVYEAMIRMEDDQHGVGKGTEAQN